MVDRPNRDTLEKAIAIYRDSMRVFLVHHLKGVPGKKLEEAVGSVLQRNHRRYEEFQRHVEQGRSVEEFIDVSDFPYLIGDYMYALFDRFFKRDESVTTETRLIQNARNRVYHPGTQDLGSEETKYYLFAISSVLDRIGRREDQRQVDEWRASIPDATTARLAQEFAQVAPTVGQHTDQIEMLQARLEELDKYREDSVPKLEKLIEDAADLEESLQDLVPRIESLERGDVEEEWGDNDEEEDGEVETHETTGADAERKNTKKRPSQFVDFKATINIIRRRAEDLRGRAEDIRGRTEI